MTDEQQLLALLYRFLDSGLITKDVDKMMDCFAPDVLGIGMGEQGFVTSHQDIRNVMKAGFKADDNRNHHLRLGRSEVKLHSNTFATICAHVFVDVITSDGKPATGMNFLQLLTAQYIDDGWKICALHASAPVLTEEELESYPLKIAEKTLQSLKKKIGDQAYQTEEQYRQAILSDTIAFYIVNLTTDQFEKSQRDSDLCVVVEPGKSFFEYVHDVAPTRLLPHDSKAFVSTFSKENITKIIEQGGNEVVLDYQLQQSDGKYLWVRTILRLIIDGSTGDQKAILYVRDIDNRKREELELQAKATTDGMTGLFNKTTLVSLIAKHLLTDDTNLNKKQCCLAVIDIDDFKDINDNYGHPIGDIALIAIADALRKHAPVGALVARIGGDEFSVFLPDCQDTTQAHHIFDKLMKCVLDIQLSEIPQYIISCSIGAVLSTYDNYFEQLYQRADEALYYSKNNGKKKLTIVNTPENIK